MSEWEFIGGMAQAADARCLEVNNVYVQLAHHGFDPYETSRRSRSIASCRSTSPVTPITARTASTRTPVK